MALSIKEKKFECTFLVVILSLTALGMVCVRPVKAQYNGFTSFAINADGSVRRSTAPIEQTGNIYTLTSDVTGSISVERSNIIFDGNGHAIVGGPTEIGVGGLSLNQVSNVTVKNVTVTGSVFGIDMESASNVTVTNNTITGTGNGILSLDEPTAGIYVEGGGSNIIAGNSLVNNYDGMSFIETENNLIVENNITNSSNPAIGDGTGIMFWGASNNTIYHNNFINNPIQAYDDSFNSPFSVNIWDDGYSGGGNYWSDYHTKYPNATEIDTSGIGNTPYVIDSQNKDQYPLMEPFTITPPKISLLSPLNQIYNESSVSLVFSVDKVVNWTGYSLDGKQNVTLTGNSTVANMTNGLHSITVYANDTFGNFASQTISFTIAKQEPFPTVTVAAVSGASAVALVCIGLFLYYKKRCRGRKP